MQNKAKTYCLIFVFICILITYTFNTLRNNNNESISVFATSSSSDKVIILTFDDDWKNQYIYVKPILDKYGFKATFYITPGCISYQNQSFCNNTATPESVMNWSDIKSLQENGHNIESHGMSHKDLTALSDAALEYEIGQSKMDLLDKGINSTIFGNAFASGADNSTVIKKISKYYDMARAGYGNYAFLKAENNPSDMDVNNTQTSSHRYSLNVFSHYVLDNTYKYDRSKILSEFIEWVNNQTQYHNDGEINAIPIIVYHNIDSLKNDIDPDWVSSTTDVDIFDEEMKYLYENNIMVLTMSDLGYNQSSGDVYIKNFNPNSTNN
jgi:peptidoglycan/xylan/chitin deacetylase (PgdA/CDA1 family)